MNTDVDVLTEHLLQREREGWEARMKLNAGIDRHMDRQGIETEGEVHEHRHRLTAPLLQRERERGGRKESARQREVGEAYMLLNADIRRPRYVTKSEREGRREPDRGRGDRYA